MPALRLVFSCAWCVWMLSGCQPDRYEFGQGADATDTGSELGSDSIAVAFDDIDVQLSPAMPTVARVTWTTDIPTIGAVSFGEVGGPIFQTRADLSPATTHEALLVGLPEGAMAELAVLAWTEEGGARSGSVPFGVGTLAADIPRPRLALGQATDSVGGFTILPVAAEPSRWVTIVDASGRLVWGFGGDQLATQRVRLTQDGAGLVVLDREMDTPELELVRVDFDGTIDWRLTVPGGHHDFDVIDDETFVVLAADVREFQGPDGPVTLIGDKLVEVDLDGGMRTLWSVWDHVEPELRPDMWTSPKYPDALDWSHGNYLRYDRDSDTVHLTLREIDLAVAVDRTSGQTHWILGSQLGDYQDQTSDGVLHFPHSAWPLGDDLLVFNQRDSFQGECAEAAILTLDDDRAQVERTWRYLSESCHQVSYLGNAQPLDQGRILVAFSTAGVLEEVDGETATARWRLTVDSPTWILYTERFLGFGTNAAGQ